ncbi:MAG: hypothetical protein GMKNLPBB_00111 [Myxococcota bacterium]|nr:hypothetical protein [Myxococcota bacterium]
MSAGQVRGEGSIQTAMRLLAFYWDRRYLLVSFVKSDLKKKYTESAMGIYWSVINPFVQMAIYTYVFSALLRVEFHSGTGAFDYSLYLFCGVLPWIMISESILKAATSIRANRNLVHMSGFPASFLPTHIVLSNALHGMIGLVILLGALLVSQGRLNPTILLLPVVLALQILLTLGVSWFVSAVNVLYRDVEQILANSLLLWMFITPIFYSSKTLPDQFQWVLVLNPVAHLVDIWRELIMKNDVPVRSMGTLLVYSLVISWVGYRVFARIQPRFTDLV